MSLFSTAFGELTFLYSIIFVLQVYERLQIKIVDRGESFYQSRMEDVVKLLDSKGMLEEDEGRKVSHH